jgi:1-acyl-sn-glycerol-3-phosphate acyltransferase
MYELMLLSGQEYVDVYATSVKKNVIQTAIGKAREIQAAPKKRMAVVASDGGSSETADAADGADSTAGQATAGLAPSGEGVHRRAS